MPRIGSSSRTRAKTIEALDALVLLLSQLHQCGLIPANVYAHLNFVMVQMRAVVPITERTVTVNAISDVDLHRRYANV